MPPTLLVGISSSAVSSALLLNCFGVMIVIKIDFHVFRLLGGIKIGSQKILSATINYFCIFSQAILSDMKRCGSATYIK